MSVELQSTMIGVGIIAGMLIASACMAGLPLASIPVFGMGIGAAFGALIGDLFHSSVVGAIIGASMGLSAMIVWWIRKNNREDAERLRRREAQQQ